VDQLRWLLSDPDMRHKLAQRAKADVQQNYDWAKLAAQTAELYRQFTIASKWTATAT
jgi:1,4-alpha-glucan branching enzyme